jgi:type IV pilus assembly protein PilV
MKLQVMSQSSIASNCKPSLYNRFGLHARSKGFSLIEILVTLVILSLGLLGVAGLLVNGISNAASSEAMTKANQLAAEMADRIRANPAVGVSASSEYITTYAETVSSLGTGTLSIAKKDKSDWLSSLATQLPLGDGKITSSVSGTVRKLVIEIQWNNCIGTLTDAEKVSCADGSSGQFKRVTYELHL